MKQKRGISRYLYTVLFLLLATAIVAMTGSCGGGGGDGGGGAPPAGPTTGVWDSSTWDNATGRGKSPPFSLGAIAYYCNKGLQPLVDSLHTFSPFSLTKQSHFDNLLIYYLYWKTGG